MAESSSELFNLEDNQEEAETAGEIFKKLTTAWVNEKCCPDLLKVKKYYFKFFILRMKTKLFCK